MPEKKPLAKSQIPGAENVENKPTKFEWALILGGLILIALFLLAILFPPEEPRLRQVNWNVCYTQILNSFDCKYLGNASYNYGGTLKTIPKACLKYNASWSGIAWSCSTLPPSLQKNTT